MLRPDDETPEPGEPRGGPTPRGSPGDDRFVWEVDTTDVRPGVADQATRGDAPSGRVRASLPEPGDVLGGRYLIEALLGRGGMGAVFRAVDQTLRRPVAIKVLTAASRQAAARFAREAEVAASAGVRGVVAVHEDGDHLGLPYIVMELVEGQSLDAWLKLGPLEPAAAARLLEQVARTLAVLHARGIVHRDIKPSNVLIGADGLPRLADFGLARRDVDARLTGTGELVGTPLYMAPEVVVGQPSSEALADVYALGCVAYQAVTGHLPVEAKTFAELIATYARGGGPPPPSTWRRLPAGWDAVCARALAFDPAERHPSAGALADDLAVLAAGGVVRAPRRWRRRRPALAAMAAVAAALIAGAAWARRAERARATVAEFREWDGEACELDPASCAGGEHRLASYRLGLGAAELDGAALEPWSERIDAAAAFALPSTERAGLARARARLALHRRLLDHAQGRHAACLRPVGEQSPASLGADALLLAAHGQAAQALTRVGEALRLFPTSGTLRAVLDAVLAARADQAPLAGAASALAELERGDDAPLADRPRSSAALARATRRWIDEALSSPEPAARLLRLAADCADASPIAREALARAKVEAMEARATAWAESIAAGDRDVLDLLATLVRAAPPVRPGPRAAAELDRVTAAAIAAWESTRDVDLAERALELESRLWYEVGHAHRGAPPPVELVLTLLETRYDNRLIAREPSFILLGALRAVPAFVPREAIRHAATEALLRKAHQDRPFLEALAARAPAQSVEYALALLDLTGTPRPRGAQRAARLQSVLDARPADLHPERQGELLELLAEARIEAADPASLQRALEHATQALDLARDPERLEAASLLLARAHVARREPAEALAALETGVERVRAAVAALAEIDDDEQSAHPNVLARHAAHLAVELERVDPPRALDLALEVARLAEAWPGRLFVFHEQEAALAARLAALLERAGHQAEATRLRR